MSVTSKQTEMKARFWQQLTPPGTGSCRGRFGDLLLKNSETFGLADKIVAMIPMQSRLPMKILNSTMSMMIFGLYMNLQPNTKSTSRDLVCQF